MNNTSSLHSMNYGQSTENVASASALSLPSKKIPIVDRDQQLKLGIAAYRDDRLDETIEILEPLIDDELLSKKSRFEAFEKLGLARLKLNEVEKAKQIFHTMLDAGYDAARTDSILNNVATCHYRLGDFETAERMYTDVVSRRSRARGLAHYNLACVMTSKNRHDDALNQLELAMRVDSDLKDNATADKDLDAIRPYVRFDDILTIEDRYTKIGNAITRAILKTFNFVVYLLFASLRLAVSISPKVLSAFMRDQGRRVLHSQVKKECELHGIRTWIAPGPSDEPEKIAERIHYQLDEAISLIQRCSPRRYAALKKHIQSILILPLPSEAGRYVHELHECQLNVHSFCLTDEDSSEHIHAVASTIIHEACHGRVRTIVRSPFADPTFREERLCRHESARFIERAKQDSIRPWPNHYDSAYHKRFGCFHLWYYRRYGKRPWHKTVESIRKVLESGEVERDEEFLLSIWDCPDQFQLHLSELGSAIQSNSLDAAAYRDRGYDYYMIRQFELAFSDFQTAHRLDDSNPAALDWSAFLAVHLGKHEYAVEAYERLNELEPNDSSNIGTLLNQILELSRLKNKANSEAAKEVEQDASEVATLGALCDQYIQINPFCHNAMIVKARVHNHIGNTELAYETIKQVLVYHPDCKHGHLVAMEIAQNRNEFEQADAYWTCYKAIMEKESKSLRKSTLTSGVVIATSVDLDKVTLHILYSPDAKTERLNAIACSLIQKFDFADDHHNYWRAVCQLGTEQEETVALPRTVATNLGFDSTRLYLEIISLPRRHFHGSAIPNLNTTIPIRFDRKEPVNSRIGLRLEA